MGCKYSKRSDRYSGSEYEDVDKRAKTAPHRVKSSIKGLVQYLTDGVKDPKLQVRAFFVWIAENIRYDVDGYFGRTERLDGDADSVLRLGRAVCEGYANLMEELCKEANIPVQTITGFAKGYGHSPDKPYTTDTRTNHAWTAVELNGKYQLLDATWGTGSVDENGKFAKKFSEFYFLTNPRHFANNHFPYMNKDMESSNTLQFLSRPITLQQFNDSVSIKPEAFRLGVSPKSNSKAIIKVRREATVTFTKPKGRSFRFNSMLMLKEGNVLKEIPRSTFDVQKDSVYSVRLHPRSPGTYRLRIFGSDGDNGSMGHLFEYLVECTAVKDADFEFPYCYTQCQTDKCVLIAPTKYRLKANSEVLFHVQSPLLKKVMVDQTLLEKTGNNFKGRIKVGSTKRDLAVYGSSDFNGNSLNGLCRFEVA